MGVEDLAGVPRETTVDEALVAQLLRADHTAHAALCDRYGPLLNGFAAARLGGDIERAEDITAQVFAEACRNIRSFNARKATLVVWLYGIARRKILGELRKSKALKSVPLSQQISAEQMAEVATGDDLATGVVNRLEAERLVAQLTTLLSNREMEVLMLHYVESFSQSEIGHIIGRSEKAVNSLLRRAKQKARERLVRDDT